MNNVALEKLPSSPDYSTPTTHHSKLLHFFPQCLFATLKTQA